MPNKKQDDDVNELMASIMGGSIGNKGAVAPNHKKNTYVERSQDTDELEIDNVVQSSKPRLRKHLVVMPIVVISLISVVALVAIKKDSLLGLFTPNSPFSEEVAGAIDTPLYYPTKLPGTYKMEINSIVQPEEDVVVYAITDETGKKLNISLQKQPEGINLDPLYAVLSNVRTLNTDLGEVRVGKSDDNLDIVNILTGQTWIIINSGSGTISDQDLTTVINNLKV